MAFNDANYSKIDRIPDEEAGLAHESSINAHQIYTVFGLSLKHISLVALALQNSILALVMHYSRVSTPPSQAYSAATAVLLNEILKGLISFAVALSLTDTSKTAVPLSIPHRVRILLYDVFSPDCWKLSIPAILYVFQNNLQYVAASNLDATTFQVTYQMKILTTAVFSVILLGKKLFPIQWIALFFLAMGVGLAQLPAGVSKTEDQSPTDLFSSHLGSMNSLTGFMAVAFACFSSGLAGVYFEMVLKSSQAGLWVRNVQLSFFSLLPATIPIIYSYRSHHTTLLAFSFEVFKNFGPLAWATVLIQVIGGLVTALVIKHADNIMKGFATSLSILISFAVSVALFNFKISLTFILGSLIVLISTWLYNQPPRRWSLSSKESSGRSTHGSTYRLTKPSSVHAGHAAYPNSHNESSEKIVHPP